MKATMFLSFLFACFLIGCSSDDVLDDLEKQDSVTKNSISCYPSFGSLNAYAKLNEAGVTISWRGCDNTSHRHSYTVKISGSESGTYTTSDKFIMIPYTIHENSYYNITVTSNENESISGLYEMSGGTLTKTTGCNKTMARITVSHCFLGTGNYSKINCLLDISSGTHNAFYSQVYELVNGVPGEKVSGTDYLIASGRDVVNIETPYMNCDGKTTYRIRFTPYNDKCSPDATTSHYLYGDFIPTKETGRYYSVELHEVKKLDGSYW